MQTLTVTGTGRYVRMYGTARATAYGYSLWEFQVYGTIGGTGGCDTATNAALNRPVTVSSTENAGLPGVGRGGRQRRHPLVERRPAIRSGSRSTSAQHSHVCQVVLAWEAAYATAFQIQTSADGNAWTTHLHAPPPAPAATRPLTVTGTGRYVRVNGTARATAYGYSLWEFVVRTGTGAPPTARRPTTTDHDPPTTTTAATRAATCCCRTTSRPSRRPRRTTAHCTGCTPAKAFDCNPATRWATSSTTGWVDPGWIYVDLGATANIHRVVLQWDPAYATAYQIQVSADASNWTTIYTTTTGRGFKETLTVNGTGRYVRMYGTARVQRLRLLAVGVPGVRHGRQPDRAAGAAAERRPSRPPGWSSATSSTAPAGTKPDAAKWKAETGPGVNNELQYYTNNNNAPTDGAGSLVMEARREVTAGSACPGGPCQYTSARLNTSRTFTFTYGQVEARIKVTGTQGLWPAFWMLGANFPQVELAGLRRDRHHGARRQGCPTRRTPPCTRRPTSAAAGSARRTRSPVTSPRPSTPTPWTGTRPT